MGIVEDKISDLKARQAKVLEMGGEKAVAAQREKGKLTARERLDLLFDKGTFREIDMFVNHRCVNFEMEKVDIPADGVITGHGLVDGRPVFAFSQDFTARAGSLGEMHAKKICKVMDLAMKAGVPFVGINDSGGARIQEGVDALSGYGQIFFRNSAASGVIPQISAIMGPTAGGAVYSPAMTDWIFMVKKSSYMFITGPEVIKSVTGEEISFEELGGAKTHNEKSGVAHFACESDEDAINQIKTLLTYLPSNNMEDPPHVDTGDDPNRTDAALDSIIPDSPTKIYDMKAVIQSIVDNGDFFEPHQYFAQNMIIGFARLNGRAIGIIANQPKQLAGCLDINASDKATRFIRFCDAFNIPLLTIADVPGYLPGSQQEWGGIIRHGAKLCGVILKPPYPNCCSSRAKIMVALIWRCAPKTWVRIWRLPGPRPRLRSWGRQVRPISSTARRLRGPRIRQPNARRKLPNMRHLFSNPYQAANRGYIDAVIEPSETRPRLIDALEVMCTKRETRPPKKHGNIPM